MAPIARLPPVYDDMRPVQSDAGGFLKRAAAPAKNARVPLRSRRVFKKSPGVP
jgi:hypothetical protein